MLVTGPSICHVDRCPHGCTRETGCRGIATLKPKYVINSLRSAQISMRAAADHLERAKIEGHATELRDAARMIEAWIAGLSELDPAVPVGVPVAEPRCPRCGLSQSECDFQRNFPDPDVDGVPVTKTTDGGATK